MLPHIGGRYGDSLIGRAKDKPNEVSRGSLSWNSDALSGTRLGLRAMRAVLTDEMVPAAEVMRAKVAAEARPTSLLYIPYVGCSDVSQWAK